MADEDIPASDWTEQDLLTRDLADERLDQEQAETIARLQALRLTPDPDPEAVGLLERRLRAIEASRAHITG
ncbi:hypothetical protein [Streptosporangium amethystogenes]|uniref:hypothetical protein n=1 Tax=Streptosporangium amethystogenes TaxID=2002 RepID=UPI0004CA53AE|nr:hypothetical protein [Streptosporangium amethystogenes]